MKYIFIINPVSGNKKGLCVSKIIDSYCKNIGVNYKICFTSAKGHATEIAREYSDSCDTVIYSVGGDGTLNEVVNGMVNSNASLSIIPVGSGNDFYKSFRETSSKKIDIGKVNDKYFVNIASLGIDANVAEYATELKNHGVPTNLIYSISMFHNLIVFKPIELIRNNQMEKITILTICNGKYYGGGFKIAPNAILNDGYFDVYKVNDLSKLKMLRALFKLVKGNHTCDSNFKFNKLNSLEVNSNYDISCNVDGEIINGKSFKFSLIERALNLKLDDELKINKILKLEK